MIFWLFLPLFFSSIFAATPNGTLIHLTPDDILSLTNTLNRERQSYGIPVLDWDDGVAKVAERDCVKCLWNTQSSNTDRGKYLASLKGFKWTDERYQSTGVNKAAAAGDGANPTPALWFSEHAQWDCKTNKCTAHPDCLAYTQVIWEITNYVGCSKCACVGGNPYPNEGDHWTYLVCVFNEAGNLNHGHPFGSNHTTINAICAGNYTLPLPPQPPACGPSVTSCTLGHCARPVVDATCGADGVWRITRSITLHELSEIQCAVVITENLTGTSADILRVNNCGLLSVLGETHFTGTPTVDYNFRAVGGITPRSWYKFIHFGHHVTSSVTFKPVVVQVWSPTVQLCDKAVTGASGGYIYLYDCSIASPNLTLIPSSDFLYASPGHTTYNYDLAQDGDINNPNFTGAVPVAPSPPGTHHSPTHAPGAATSHHLAGWAVFLIVLAVLVVIALIIGLIVIAFVKKNPTETV
jgi:hypothetical protein